MGQAISRPEGETERLVAVRSIMSFKNAEMPELKALSQLAQGVFGVPRAAVHIVDEDWLHIAEQAGMQLSECPRDLSICNRVVSRLDVVAIPDLTEHPDFRFMSYVKSGPELRSYAGAPIELEPGFVIGAFCLVDTVPRKFSRLEVDNLRSFALLAAALLRLQKANFTMSLAERELRDAAMTDPLTGFYNRNALDAIVDGQLGAALREKETFGVLYLDMDGFKSINDTFGHPAGDRVLNAAAGRIRNAIRGDDIVVRMGGDEFAIFIPRPSSADVLNGLADRLLAAFRKPFDVDGRAVDARLSIGGALAPQAGTDRAALLRSVDEALYQAKKSGRDRFVSRAL
ncbi:sensor domain-containing diguanylate cyclase [Agrobacterium rhizogenes]|uniref:sensor domain-containing diguanylate cyclase n=1 Tax=Rhizobium rhizogenes TaxID=359 RepID=UPI0022B6CFDA|nr:sensor domain-containing diguanylate cyclase [Rhizobium rhizogenes]MCZ7448710.1 sensor domain-containing diguanylate cyclase [Rhizobium rhizogenes]